MDRRRATDPDHDGLEGEGPPEASMEPQTPDVPSPDTIVSGLPVAGVSRRRIAFLVGALVVAWVVVVFARQVGEASAATDRADAAAVENGRLTAEVAGLQRELGLVQTTPYIVQEARAYGLGSHGEVAFRLASDASPLPSDAPGSAATRVGTPSPPRSPLESWLTLLFGSDR
jgi:cell division protein FtsB